MVQWTLQCQLIYVVDTRVLTDVHATPRLRSLYSSLRLTLNTSLADVIAFAELKMPKHRSSGYGWKYVFSTRVVKVCNSLSDNTIQARTINQIKSRL